VIKCLYTIKLIELINSAVGLTERSLWCNALQSSWQLFFIVVVIDGQPQVHTEHLTLHLLLVYTLLELVRLPYACLRVLDVRIRLLAVAQANVRLLLHPIAMILEATLLYKALPLFEHGHAYSLYLPNQLNASFHMPTLIRLYLLLGLFPCKCSKVSKLTKIPDNHADFPLSLLPMSVTQVCYLTVARLLFYRSSVQQHLYWRKIVKSD
jgi:very-long-chain (3R)-3-hydroxyacyl-CoA dehydratase